MSILSDNTLWELRHTLFPNQELDKSQFQPCSIDLRLDKELKTINGDSIDITEKPFYLTPDDFVLGSTLEKINLPSNLLGRVEGRSSLGRLGIMIHITAGFIDPGFNGNITLEIKNVSRRVFKLSYLDRVCQIVFEELDQPARTPYTGKYQGDTGVVCSKME